MRFSDVSSLFFLDTIGNSGGLYPHDYYGSDVSIYSYINYLPFSNEFNHL